MRLTWPMFWTVIRHGEWSVASNQPWMWGRQFVYYDGWHLCLHCGPFSVGVFW